MSQLLVKCLVIVVWCGQFYCEDSKERPKIKISNGDLILEPAFDKNIYLSPNGPKSSIFFGEINYKSLYNVTNRNIEFNPLPNYNPGSGVSQYNDLQKRTNNLETLTNSLSTNVNSSISHLNRRISNLNRKISTLQASIRRQNECQSRPCENGGTCLDLSNGHFCLCPTNWKGVNCEEDVNECRNYAGTDLGCQNGATCINKPGSYECICKPGWYGIDCTRTAKNCSQGDYEMCGHGICVPVTSGDGIRCICDQGWTTNEKDVACLTDVNECESSQGIRCSINPRVECINLPGSFRCGACPMGYEGDGIACYDIDECLVSNGGCSTNPMVTCHNTIGTRICGPCPPGYQGDGVTCTWRGSCSINHGGCHPSAQCIENSALNGQTQCVCPIGMSGDGIGRHGCYVSVMYNTTDESYCDSNPCGAHGHCHPLSEGYTCICYQGYGGAHCDKLNSLCTHNPCLNGGTCRLDSNSPRGYRCECTALYSGYLCQIHSQPCGGILDAEEGSIIYPASNTTYNDNSRCAWVIHTAPNKVINVTFTKFKLEDHPTCNYDFVQIHDGRSSASQLIGRFCGNTFPRGGNIISSHNNLYFWFRSDHSVAKEGFSLHWTSVAPVCGGEIDATVHGHISSPGSPGKYPPGRDCFWHLSTTLGKRIQLHFFELDIEVHANCSFDYLAIYDGEHNTDPLLNRYCNSTQPAPIQSAGSDILIHFHSDLSGDGKGFQITYASVEGVPGCGGLYTTEKGEITSPSYNNVYLTNLLCEYKIRTRPDTKIRIEFKSFQLERSFRCKYDYLKIYDGPSVDSPLVGRFCGTRYQKIYTSSTNSIFIIFKSDHSVASEGFKITYESICEKIFSGDSGIIRSPGYPISYPLQIVCDYIISAAPGKAIELHFQDLDIEDNRFYNCQYDSVEIRDGPSINSTLMGNFCGGSESTPPIQTSTHNFMFIRFKSDISISGRGFYANYTTIDTNCGGIYKNVTGIINHPAEENGLYGNDESCTWMIIAPEGMHIKLTWNRFNLESMPSCNSDYIKIIEYDTNNNNSTLGKYCGETLPPALTTFSNRISIEFKSDLSIREEGFSVSYSFLDEKSHCGGIYVKSHGTIYSPGWPQHYEHNRDCSWTVTLPIGQRIMLNITDFYLERGFNNRCDMSDYVAIWDGTSQNASLLTKLCGEIKSKQLITTANSVHIIFHSDAYINDRGFKINWDGSLTGCGGTLTGASGSISSPNYPQEYHDNAECFYRIVTSSGSRIRISFTELDLENTNNCRDDYVEIFDGYDSNSISLGKQCFMTPKLNNIETSTNYAYIKFRSDIFISSKGFFLNYFTICNNNLTGSFGIIESPGFPNYYPIDTNCLWNISVPKGNKINITFTHFDVLSPLVPRWSRFSRLRHPWLSSYYHANCDSSYVQFKDAVDENFSDKKCGKLTDLFTNKRLQQITTKSNSLQIRFVTGHYLALISAGFRLEWISYGCGGHLQKSYGTLSMDRNFDLSGQFVCEWIIEVPEGRAVTITFSQINMDSATNCSKDALELYNGPSKSSPLLSTICTKSMTVVQTTSNFLFIRLVKNSHRNDVYFTSHFNSLPESCGGTIRGTSGFFHSKNYPKNYDNNLDCIWSLAVPNYHRIEINFMNFDLYYSGGEDDEDDCGDSIKIYDNDIRSNYSYLLCPKTNISSPIISKDSSIRVQFISDAHGSAKGFQANFTMTCGATIIAKQDGLISNHDFINQQNKNCTWTLKAPNLVDKIKLTIKHMSVPKFINVITNKKCPTSFLKILDGEDETSPLIGEFCGKKLPPTIVSQGNTMTIIFGSYTDSPTGVFEAHYTTLINACGGSLTSEEGAIASPNYPLSYPNSVNCEWTLSTSPGNRVYITFENMDIDFSENCNEDYLEIRENNGIGNLLAIYCGQDIPLNTTTGTKLYLKFHSENENVGTGFLLHYGFLHGNEITGLREGEIASPLYPYPFEGQGEYTWRVITDRATTISLNIDRLDIRRNGDVCNSKLIIYDGYDSDAPVISENCGYLQNQNKILQTTSNVVYILLSLDILSNFGILFHIQWSQISRTIDVNMVRSTNCGLNQTNFVSAETGGIEFHSPNFPNEYNNNLNCSWSFNTDPGRHLSLIFNEISLEETPTCFADSISILSLTGVKWTPVTEKFCLASYEKKSFESFTAIKVIFQSDASMARKGFNATIRSNCGGLLEEKSGIIEVKWSDYSPRYENNLKCNWTVKVRPGRTVQLQFLHFNITNDNDCTNYVMLRNGDSVESPLLGSGKFCGFSHENRNSIISSSNAVFISYVAVKPNPTWKIKFQNFKLYYEEKNIECGGTSSLSQDHKWEIITSPKYPDIPTPYTECIWTFTGPPGEILRIDFQDYFKLEYSFECTHESIEIRDGISQFSPLKKRICKENPGTIKTNNNAMYIKYSTQISDPKNGFKANVSIDVCGGTIVADSGEISSPGYPHMYIFPWGTICTWRIISVTKHSFKISLKDVKLPESEKPCETKLTFEELIPINDTFKTETLKELCDDDIVDYSALIESSSNNITIKFQLGKPSKYEEISESRFRITFNSSRSSCITTIKESEGYLMTPGYPIETTLMFCQWTIEVPNVNRRIHLEILDLDKNDVLGVFNDISYRSQITANNQNMSNQFYESSGNQMLLYVSMASRSKMRHRFKAKFTSDAPALCGGLLYGIQGEIRSPDLQQNYLCQWKYSEKAMYRDTTYVYKTISVNIKLSSSSSSSICRSSDSRLSIYSNVALGGVVFVRDACGNNTEVAYSIPASNMNIKAFQFKERPLIFDMTWKLHPCGGVIYAAKDEINIINVPSDYNETVDCAWIIIPPFGVRIEIRLDGEFNLDCSDEFIKVHKGVAQYSNPVGDYCKNKKQNKFLTVSFMHTFVKYHSKFQNKINVKLFVKTISAQCGGYLTYTEKTFSSPNFPNNYSDNQECTWEIQADIGYRVSLQFINRFAIEETKNCTKDAIILYDWKENKYDEMSRLCGRVRPPIFNSTSNQMKVVFRTDEKTSLDGFYAKWEPICGGTLIAKNEEKVLYSPGYFNDYHLSLDCTYEIKGQTNSRVLVKFLDFETEGTYPECEFDNVTLSVPNDYSQFYGTYCGKETPPILESFNTIQISYKTDRYVQKRGFKMSYVLYECGGIIKNHTTITSGVSQTYSNDANCTWLVEAPINKIVLVKFIFIHLESSYDCYNDYIAVYDGPNVDLTKRLSLMCGNVDSPTVIKSNSNKMVIQFVTDSNLNYDGFKAVVLFTYSESAGCGGIINLTSASNAKIKSPLLGGSYVYENYLDCHWIIEAPINHVINIEFTSFHIASCVDVVNQTAIGFSKCDCDFVELKDGINPNSLIIGTFCGHNTPSPITSSGNHLTLRLATDGEAASSGFEAVVSSHPSVCGQSTFLISHKVQVLKSPGYDAGVIPRGLHCSYYLDSSNEPYSTIHVKIKNLDLDAGINNNCEKDKLILYSHSRPRNESSGKDFILNEPDYEFTSRSIYFFHSTLKYPRRFKLCGSEKSIDYYLTTSSKINLITTPETTPSHKGVEIEISYVGFCGRNYTELQGRILSQYMYSSEASTFDCYTLISVPETYTISIHFTSLNPVYWNQNAKLEIFDGNSTSAPLLKKIAVEYVENIHVFSTGRYVLMHNHVIDSEAVTFDLNYVATNKGRGCGGKINADSGTFSSPLYPDEYRRKITCEWEIETPVDTRIMLRFKVFDLGVVCDQNYLSIVDRSQNTVSTFCSEAPADYTSPDNYVKIAFTTTMNNGGTGWVLEYVTVV